MFRAALAGFLVGLLLLVFGVAGVAGTSREAGRLLLGAVLVLGGLSLAASAVMVSWKAKPRRPFR